MDKDLIEGYGLSEIIGKGATATVFKANQKATGRTVALKMLRVAPGEDRLACQRFIREGKLLMLLDHPNIIKGLEVGLSNNIFFMALEYFPSRSLLEGLSPDTPCRERTALLYGRQAAEALAYLAQRRILHGDIKPANFLVNAAGQLKLCDLGLARRIQEQEEGPARQRELTFGTAAYISPEQARGSLALDGRADLYSLGATLFHLLAGRPPFLGESSAEVLEQQINRPPPLDLLLARRVSAEALELVGRLLAKAPDDRFAQAGEVAAACRALLGEAL